VYYELHWKVGHALAPPDLHPLVPVDQAVLLIAEYLDPAGIKRAGVRLGLVVMDEAYDNPERNRLADLELGRAVLLLRF
jgi:hypothetical protein